VGASTRALATVLDYTPVQNEPRSKARIAQRGEALGVSSLGWGVGVLVL